MKDIVKNPRSSYKNLEGGGLEIRDPEGKGIRFDANGKLSGFLDAKQ